ncbi:MAG TPA: hypothetical protein VMM78_05860 [Thermomicrobiales bacterium]|nr:hypothetical protein [Thermomicrobiales bacterium]
MASVKPVMGREGSLAWACHGPEIAMVMGFSSMIVMWGMMSGPIIAGAMADYFGNYQWGFTVLAALAGCGSIFFILATKPTPPRGRWV